MSSIKDIQSILAEDSKAKLEASYQAGKHGSSSAGDKMPSKNAKEILKGPGVEETAKAANATGRATHPENDSKAKNSSSGSNRLKEDDDQTELEDNLEETEETSEDPNLEESEDSSDEGFEDEIEEGSIPSGLKKWMEKNKGKSNTDSKKKNEKEDSEDDEEEKSEKMKKSEKEESFDVSQHMDALFNGETLSEDFKAKAETIFAAALAEREQAIRDEIESQYAEIVENSVQEVHKELSEQLDNYLNYVAQTWLEENALQVENGLKLEIAESFIEGLRELFLTHDIDVPESKADLVEDLNSRISELEEELSKEMNRNIELTDALEEHAKDVISTEISESLTDADKNKFMTLCENVSYSSLDEFENKAKMIYENYFGINKSSKKVLTENSDIGDNIDGDDSTSEDNLISEDVSNLANQISRYSGKN